MLGGMASEVAIGAVRVSAVMLIFPARVLIWLGAWAIIGGTPRYKLYGVAALAVGIGGYWLIVRALRGLAGDADEQPASPIQWRTIPSSQERLYMDTVGRRTTAPPRR